MERFVVEIRKLPAATLSHVAHILEVNNDWQKVACLIPKDLTGEQSTLRYNMEDIRLIEEHAKITKRKCAEILFDEWGTAGLVRPTIHTLMEILIQAQMFRAVDEIARILGEQPPQRPRNTPADYVPMPLTELLNNDDEIYFHNLEALCGQGLSSSENSEYLPDFNVLMHHPNKN